MFSKLQFQSLLIYENISTFYAKASPPPPLPQTSKTQQLILIYTEVFICFNFENQKGFFTNSQPSKVFRFWEARDGAVVRVLPSDQCGPGSNPGVDAICGLSLLLVLSLAHAPRGFSPGTPVFPSPQKPTFPNSNSTRNQPEEEPLCGCSTSKSLLIYLSIYFLFQNLTVTHGNW